MQIIITSSMPATSGPGWEALQHMLRTMCNGDGTLTRISRTDGQANYRDTDAEYWLSFRLHDTTHEIKLEVRS